ncbi:hypothetical protein ACGFLS_30690 [Streptomyces abikoensis]|uniref:deoxynucleotide monophosphate kinase family protein n=1 Tax=Streptomyces abikoensis TaxID=97398 RepID=UPI00371273ED
MGHPHLALIGRKRTGKDAVAARLTARYFYTRVAFADPLKDMALQLDPVITYEPAGYGPLPVRLSDVVRRLGWERAKDAFPEVRRTLQHLGEGVRQHSPDYWLDVALSKVDVADTWRLPVVVTDCRYPNEAVALKSRGFTLVRIIRPDTADPSPQHESETALDTFPADVTIANLGTLADLNAQADSLI